MDIVHLLLGVGIRVAMTGEIVPGIQFSKFQAQYPDLLERVLRDTSLPQLQNTHNTWHYRQSTLAILLFVLCCVAVLLFLCFCLYYFCLLTYAVQIPRR